MRQRMLLGSSWLFNGRVVQIAGASSIHSVEVRDIGTDLITVNREWTASVVVARSIAQPSGNVRWNIRFDMGLRPDITVAVRMDQQNEAARDYYLVPRLDTAAWPRHVGYENSAFIDGYCFDDLSILSELAARIRLWEAA